MTTEQKTPEVRMTIEGHICVISLDNAAKKNAITPALMSQLSTHLTTFEDDDNLWVAIMDPAGEHTTAGLDMPKFFGPSATAKPIPKDQVDPFALHRRTTKPVISVVHGITYTIGIEMMLAGDIVIAADTARFCQLESKRGIAPLGGAHFRVTVHPPIAFTPSGDNERDVLGLTAKITATIEELVRKRPSQWLWIHRRWTSPRDKIRQQRYQALGGNGVRVESEGSSLT